MIQLTTGNILSADAEALVNTVNCVGVMGKGIALQFKKAFPEIFRPYKKACDADEVQPGRIHVVELNRLTPPHVIINFPTKRHWRSNSRLEDLEAGLEDLVRVVRERDIESIAIPPLGCGLGGLDWSDVRPMIEEAFESLEDVQVLLYEPGGGPDVDDMPVRTERPKLTRARALFIKLIDLYKTPGYRSSRIEVQKLAYFLQTAGEQLKLRFKKHQYGPFANNLNHVLQKLDGHYIVGFGDRKKRSEIRLAGGALEEATEFLINESEAQQRLERVGSLIEGYETPYGMELLATVHWAGTEADGSDFSADEAVEAVHNWNERKRRIFQPHHIVQSYEHLRASDWLRTN